MGIFLRLFGFSFIGFALLSCGEGLYQKAPENVTSSRAQAFFYTGHSESLPFQGHGLKNAQFTVSPALPSGLRIDENLPGVVGTPTAASVLQTYRVHVTSDFGSTDFEFDMKVNLGSPSPSNLKDIFTGGSSSPVVLGRLGEQILFAAESNVQGRELWKTDGTNAGTVLVKDIDSGVGNSGNPTGIALLQNADPFSDLMLFSAETAGGGIELYKTDGTTVGTAQIAHLEPGTLAKAGSHFVFSANDAGGVGIEPYAASLTGGSVTNLADIDAAGDSSPEFFTELGDQVLFFASDSAATGKELYATDGTSGGTALVKDINVGAGDSPGTWAPIAFNGYVYFGADDGAHGLELWRSDGTVSGTTLFKDIAGGATSSDPGNFVVFNGVLYFTADDNIHGLELWRTDGTVSGTYLVKDINGTSSGSVVTLFSKGVSSSYLFFSADDNVNGEELWRTDGTASGTGLVRDIQSGVSGSAPLQLTVVSDVLFFSATTTAKGRELWKSTGTSTGTALAADLNTGVADGIQTSDSFYEFEGVLYFPATTPTVDKELYKVTPY